MIVVAELVVANHVDEAVAKAIVFDTRSVGAVFRFGFGKFSICSLPCDDSFDHPACKQEREQCEYQKPCFATVVVPSNEFHPIGNYSW